MAKQLTITIPDLLALEIQNIMIAYKYTNKSEFCAEMIRNGIIQFKRANKEAE